MRFVRLLGIIFQHPVRLTIAGILVSLFLCVVVPILIPIIKTPKQRITEASSLGPVIPDDASDFEYEIGEPRGFYLNIAFKAPPQSAQPFIDKICNGVLHAGYDPFNAVDSIDPSPGAYLIKVTPGYYSYSPHTPATIWGNRCDNPIFTRIRVDQADPEHYSIKYEQQSSCGFAAPVGSCALYGIYSFAHPIRDIWWSVTGIRLSPQKEWDLVLNERCLETANPFWKDGDELANARVRISVDQQPMPAAIISDNSGLLYPDTARNVDYSVFHYCLQNDWREGMHEMEIHVTTQLGKQMDYAWKFLGGTTF